MRKTKSQQKYLPKINHLTIDADFEPPSQLRERSIDKRSESNMMEEHYSLSKTKSLKQEILRIPKARQLLNMDKHIYIQDVEKRLELLGDIREQNYEPQTMMNLQTLCKEPGKKKTKRHKTNFKVPLTRKNIDKMNEIIQHHIDSNRKLQNKEVFLLPEYEKTAPFNLDALRFIDQLNEVNKAYKQKFPYQKSNLSKNKLLLEHVILNRNVKRQLKLDKDKDARKHAKVLNAKVVNAKIL